MPDLSRENIRRKVEKADDAQLLQWEGSAAKTSLREQARAERQKREAAREATREDKRAGLSRRQQWVALAATVVLGLLGLSWCAAEHDHTPAEDAAPRPAGEGNG
jgi:hypothetical protein